MDHRLQPLDRLHDRVVGTPVLQLFTAVTRGLLAAAFVPSGLTKILGHRFTLLPTTTPVGSFFKAFFQARGYYAFIGWTQVTAALLLLVPATATVGALVYLPIIVNIFVITVVVGFQGTPVITGMMLLANIYLLCWDYDRVKALLVPSASWRRRPAHTSVLTTRFAIAVTLSVGTGALGSLTVISRRSVIGAVGLGAAGLAVGTALLLSYRRNVRAMSGAAS